MSEYKSIYELRGLIGLTPEQLLIIADEVCHQHHCSITNFSALCAASAVTTAAISGIDIHGGDLAEVEHELARVILVLKPLNKNNDVLAAVAVEVFHQVNA
jgi:fic family toxin-antitoxin system